MVVVVVDDAGGLVVDVVEVEVVLGGPVDTKILMVVPGATCVPASGLVLMTLPVFTVVDDWSTLVTLNPAPTRSCTAATR